MKKLFTLMICSVIIISNSTAQKQIFSIPHLKDSLKEQKSVAILPLRVTISYKRLPKNFNAEGNKADEKNTGINMQQGMYTYLLRKASDYSVSFQDVERTNILLAKAGIADNFEELLPDSIAKVLGVDGVIKASYSYEKTGSEAGAIAKTLVFGFGGSTGSGSLTMQIYSGESGTLLWRFYKEMNEGAFSSGDELMQRMMKKISRNFPYSK
ncbi:MAG TPA: hypothetical protein VFI29_07115 [Hanamia sp.]|nr:hypothetical protein [Hanamia sp.]